MAKTEGVVAVNQNSAVLAPGTHGTPNS
jgi:hypothetical protein